MAEQVSIRWKVTTPRFAQRIYAGSSCEVTELGVLVIEGQNGTVAVFAAGEWSKVEDLSAVEEPTDTEFQK